MTNKDQTDDSQGRGEQKNSSLQEHRSTFADLPEGLGDEIEMLRDALREIKMQADSGLTLQEKLRVLDVFGKTCTRLSTLIKTERALRGDKEVAVALNKALSEVITELGVETTINRQHTQGGKNGR